MDLPSLSQLLGIPKDDVVCVNSNVEVSDCDTLTDRSDSSSPWSTSALSPNNGSLEPERPVMVPAHCLNGTIGDPTGRMSSGRRCWWHFERNFDYSIDRELRPLEKYLLVRCVVTPNTEPESRPESNEGELKNDTPSPQYFVNNAPALQKALSNLVITYKETWRNIFGGFECFEHQRLNQIQSSIDNDFQAMMDNVNTTDSPWIGSLGDESLTGSSSFASFMIDPHGTQSTHSHVKSMGAEKYAFQTCPSTPPPYIPHSSEEVSFNDVESTRMQPISQEPDEAAAYCTISCCPGYTHNESELIVILEKKGCEPFYAFLDQLFAGLEGCRVGVRYTQALDLLTTVIQLMPELISLLIAPRIGKRDSNGRRVCYFKRLIIMIRSFLKYMGMEASVSLLEMYRDGTTGCFSPFYLLTGEKDLESRQITASMTSTILLRLFMLTRLISEKCTEWSFLDFENTDYPKRLIQRLKRFVYLPLLSMKQVHELVMPISGDFTCLHMCLLDFDYAQWVSWYLYPPPPVYILRSELLKLLRSFVTAAQLNLFGWSSRLNETFKEYTDIRSGPDYETNLRLHLYLLVTRLSCFLAPEYLSTCVNNPEYFFGTYFVMLPHAQYGLQKVVLDAFIEKEVYPFQEQILDLLKATIDDNMYVKEHVFGLRRTNATQSTILRQILSLAWHYVSAPRIADRDCGLTIDPVLDIPNGKESGDSVCSGDCKNVGIYSAPCSILFLKDMPPTTVYFHHKPGDMQPVDCIFTTADEIEPKIRNKEDFLNHSRIAANEHRTVEGTVSMYAPLEMICNVDALPTPTDVTSVEPAIAGLESIQDASLPTTRCHLGCLLMRHGLKQSDLLVDELRWSVTLQCVGTLCRFLADDPEPQQPPSLDEKDILGPLVPIWRALIELLSSNSVSNIGPSYPESGALEIHSGAHDGGQKEEAEKSSVTGEYHKQFGKTCQAEKHQVGPGNFFGSTFIMVSLQIEEGSTVHHQGKAVGEAAELEEDPVSLGLLITGPPLHAHIEVSINILHKPQHRGYHVKCDSGTEDLGSGPESTDSL
ncbi:catalase hydroperoxidase, putative [Babesia ovis]|uniref:Catalase hydroperoxidase, putative n=1 Tax=Babesia ovis TaxID=5869 RepID=A0A9W5TA84_BABOV|nr:catalase hydroperoxidase, putative [Babesia ovis]